MFMKTKLPWIGCRRSPAVYHPSRCTDDFFGVQFFPPHLHPVSNSVSVVYVPILKYVFQERQIYDKQQKYTYFFILPTLLPARDKSTQPIFESHTRRFDANCVFCISMI